MNDKALLEKVKQALNITGEYQDNTLMIYINEVKDILLNAGVKQEVLETERIIGIVARGVIDLWDYGSGGGNLSPYFFQRVAQLALIQEGK